MIPNSPARNCPWGLLGKFPFGVSGAAREHYCASKAALPSQRSEQSPTAGKSARRHRPGAAPESVFDSTRTVFPAGENRRGEPPPAARVMRVGRIVKAGFLKRLSRNVQELSEMRSQTTCGAQTPPLHAWVCAVVHNPYGRTYRSLTTRIVENRMNSPKRVTETHSCPHT